MSAGVALAQPVPQLSLAATAAILTASTLDDTTRDGVSYADVLAASTYADGAQVVKPYYPVYQRTAVSIGSTGFPPPNGTLWTLIANAYWDGFSAGVAAVPTATLYNNATAYNFGDRVYGVFPTAAFRFNAYESLQNGNSGPDPDEPDSLYWVKLGAVNRWAMFDDRTTTKSLGNFTITLKIGSTVDTVALINIAGGGTVTMTQRNSGGTSIKTWGNPTPINLTNKPSWIVTDVLTGNANSTVDITFTGTSVGSVAFGLMSALGECVWDVTSDRKSYGRIDYDPDTGVEDAARRYTVPLTDCRIRAPYSDANRLFILRDMLAEQSAIWVLTTVSGFEFLNCFGFYENWPMKGNSGQTGVDKFEFPLTIRGKV